MKFLKRGEFKELLENNAGKRFVFYEYKPEVFLSDMHVTNGDEKYPTFGAWAPYPYGEGVHCVSTDFRDNYDWSLGEYNDDEMFAVLEEDEIEYMAGLLLEAIGKGEQLE